MISSLWSRLWLAVFLATVIPIVAVLAVGIALSERSSERADLRNLERQTKLLAAILDKQTSQDRMTIRDAVASVGRRLEIFPVSSTKTILPPKELAALLAEGEAAGQVESNGIPYIYAALRLRDSVIVVSRPYERPLFDWRLWTDRFFLGFGLAALCAAVASLVVARAITRPMTRVAHASRGLARGGTLPTLPAHGPRELRYLVDSFNDMTAQLSQARETERSFLLSVSHELKTPVAAVRGFAEGQRDGVIGPPEASEFILNESGRLERLVQDLLDMARLDQHEFKMNLETIDLAQTVRDAAQRHEILLRAADVDLDLESSGHSLAIGDSLRVLQIVSNLIENALRCTPEGGRVLVEAGPGSITVKDSGPGIDAEGVKRAFERFYLYRRYREQRPAGTGLGLALVKRLALAMHGDVTVESQPGKGATFTLRLPRP